VNPARVVKGFPPPEFPPELRDANVQGDVLVQLIVDSAGRADMRSALVLEATRFEFARAVFDVLPDFQFHVATINGCRAKQLVQMPFAFRLRR
jgi:Gram-negative bacterial TonB protein C-terminal